MGVSEQPHKVWTVREVVESVAEFMEPNEVACSLRPVNKFTADVLSKHKVVRLSKPAPTHAFSKHWSDRSVQRRMSVKQRRDLVRLTASSGSTANLQVALDDVGCLAGLETAMAAAASFGHLEACKLLHDHGCACDAAALAAAARTGRLDVVQWMLLSAGCPFSLQSLEAGAAAGHDAVCDWIISIAPCSEGEGGAESVPKASVAAAAAASGGHVALMERLLSQQQFTAPVSGPESGSDSKLPDMASCAILLRGVAEGCDLGTLEWLHQVWLDNRTDAAAQPQQGPPPLAEQDQPPPPQEEPGAGPQQAQVQLPAAAQEAIIAAAARSRTADWAAKLEWLLGRGYPRAAVAWIAATSAAEDASEVLARFAWLKERDFPRLRSLGPTIARLHTSRAAEFMSFFERREPMLAREAERLACVAGDVAALQALHAEGVEVHDVRNLRQLAASGSVAGMAWMLGPVQAARAARLARMAAAEEEARAAGRSPPRYKSSVEPVLSKELFAAGARSGSMEVLEWLHERGCEWDAATFVAVAGSGLAEALDWLVERGCPIGDDGEAYVQAAGNGDMATLEELRRLGCPWGPHGRAFTGAAAFAGPLPAMQWLLQAGCPVDWRKAEAAAALRRRRPDVLAWIREQRGPAAAAPGPSGGDAAADELERRDIADALQPVSPEASERNVVIVDNGGTPFLVRISYAAQLATVYRSRYISPEESDDSEAMFTFRFQRVFVGLDPREREELAASETDGGSGAAASGSGAAVTASSAPARKVWWYGGNSVLIHLGGRRYVYVGSMIFAFTALDEIVDYVSTMGNSAVPYPFAIGTNNAYCLLEATYLPDHVLERYSAKEREDPYTVLYGSELNRWLPGADPHAGPFPENSMTSQQWARQLPLPGLNMLAKRPMWGW
ncbi:hypothetical protein GPECTOR_5g119 [Gonium pectorale]|uniref:Uncharacterized protein n=1 Tax=Gonium pectorale TaxID=33097 RepID=A0A150GWF7_GONPE|nr:hypothetical protein GPECTOR_5g119 [Gonium pectorale]|eukprot:KXZ54008.1 hypothetical protein GPECTOR_5g119 [Gonium pectorale]